MNQSWRIVVAVLVFLALVLFGAVGGCTMGFVVSMGTEKDLVGVLIAVGLVGGIVMGALVARQILRQPRE